jgi:hypothetical protein
MPQAPQHLRALFCCDRDAWDALKGNFTDTRGLIQPKPGHTPTEYELLAVDYMCLEWDYGYETIPAQS